MGNTFNRNLHIEASGELYERARALRKRETYTESVLWELLRNKKLDGLKFRRQHPLIEYIADFYCHEIKLVIELDGTVHNEDVNTDYDTARTIWMEELGVSVLRFSNYEVEHSIGLVLNKIRIVAKDLRQGKTTLK
ncbi:MAG: DUF559 domain-containing protein [Chitinophagales bacterium]|nr:DUF559 domain-containing protein [Chitinophagales bacterium]